MDIDVSALGDQGQGVVEVQVEGLVQGVEFLAGKLFASFSCVLSSL